MSFGLSFPDGPILTPDRPDTQAMRVIYLGPLRSWDDMDLLPLGRNISKPYTLFAAPRVCGYTDPERGVGCGADAGPSGRRL